MSAAATNAREPHGARLLATAGPPGRVLVVYERGRNGAAALDRAAELIAATNAALTVVTLARQDTSNRCCGPSPRAYNCAVREQAALELREARDILGPTAADTELKVLVGSPEPQLAAWAAEQRFETILLPRHRLAPGGHPAARRLRRATTAEVRLVSSR